MTDAISPPSLETIESLAREAFERIPPELSKMTGDVVFIVQDFAEEEG